MKNRNLKRSAASTGFTLVEVLVGLAATLLILLAMVQAFKFASAEMQEGRASLELTSRLRATQSLLRDDLRRLTVEAKPYYHLASAPNGYFEIADGPKVDINNLVDDADPALPTVIESTTNLIVGDYDDIFAGTIKSDGQPFRGRGPVAGSVVESNFAEVAWFTTFTDADNDGFAEPADGDQIRLYRRQLVIRPGTPLNPTTTAGGVTTMTPILWNAVNGILQRTDVSARVVLVTPAAGGSPATYNVIANSLSDLTFRGNRFGHQQFTTAVDRLLPQNGVIGQALLQSDPQYQNPAMTFTHRRSSNQNDLMLNDLAAFDIRVFEPNAMSLIKTVSGSSPANVLEVAEPSDVATRVSLVSRTTVPGAGIFTNRGLRGTFDGNEFGDPTNGALIDTLFEEDSSATESVGFTNRIGAYVDLGKNPFVGTTAATAPFTGAPFEQLPAATPRLPLTGTLLRAALPFNDSYTLLDATGGLVRREPVAIFDTGTPNYDRLPTSSFGTNGIDDNGDGNVDEFGTEKLAVPYAGRIRGIKFVVRMYEPNTNQVTQMTLKQSMLPK